MRWVPLLFIIVALTGCQKGPESEKDRIERLGSRLRCPVCRGVPISESPATLAVEMMQLLRDQASQGKSDDEILTFFETRYGEWVLLKPKAQGMNLLIWILPAIFLVGGIFLILYKARPRKS